MKIQDLTDAQLDKWVAMAQGWKMDFQFGDGLSVCWTNDSGVQCRRYNYNPTSNDAQAMALVKEFKLVVGYDDEKDIWASQSLYGFVIEPTPSDKNLNRAICLAVVASVYGDEVEEVE